MKAARSRRACSRRNPRSGQHHDGDRLWSGYSTCTQRPISTAAAGGLVRFAEIFLCAGVEQFPVVSLEFSDRIVFEVVLPAARAVPQPVPQFLESALDRGFFPRPCANAMIDTPGLYASSTSFRRSSGSFSRQLSRWTIC